MAGAVAGLCPPRHRWVGAQPGIWRKVKAGGLGQLPARGKAVSLSGVMEGIRELRTQEELAETTVPLLSRHCAWSLMQGAWSPRPLGVFGSWRLPASSLPPPGPQDHGKQGPSPDSSPQFRSRKTHELHFGLWQSASPRLQVPAWGAGAGWRPPPCQSRGRGWAAGGTQRGRG